jgi:50S ribosomal protein L16 3-hydroxylase
MTTLLGGMTPQAFLDAHWQKKALLVRQAVPEFQGLVSRDELFALAQREDVMSRLVTLKKGRLKLMPGPVTMTPSQLGAGPWSILVQGIEALVPAGQDLLARFEAIVPRARLDDLMVSWATEGGGVGPHTDRYDVFLLQGAGRRRWQLSTRTFAPDDKAELPTLKGFVPEVEYVLDPGDMLYLPPGVAHHGVAVDGPCFTYSIGAVAPTVEGLLQNFLGYLSQKIEADVDMSAMYADPDLQAPAEGAAHVISDATVARVTRILDQVRFGPADVDEFLGRLLTGPKPTVEFDELPRAPTVDDVRKHLLRSGIVRLTLPSRGLVRGRRIFLNGETVSLDDDADLRVGSALIEQRQLSLPLTKAPSAVLAAFIAEGLQRGFLQLVAAPKR